MSEAPSPFADLLGFWADTAAGVVGPGDGQRLAGLWKTALDELAGDLARLKPTSFAPDLAPLTDAWRRVAAGSPEPGDDALLRSFSDTLGVKSRLGAEYYADPSHTHVAPTPRHLAHREGAMELYRYDAGPDAPAPRGAPLLIVYSVINRSYILDLAEDCSFVAHLLQAGCDVWMIEWNGHEDREATLDTYVDDGIGGAIEHIKQQTGAPKVALFGHCIGGTLAAMAAARQPDSIDRLFLLTAPFRPADGGVVRLVTDPSVLDVDKLVGHFGHMPAKLIRYTFMALKPWYEASKWRNFVHSLDEPGARQRFAVVDRWANDNVDVPAGVFAPFLKDVLQSTRLLDGEAEIRGELVDLSRITCPVLALAGKDDWIVPPDCAKPVLDRVSSEEATFLEMPGAHLSLVLDKRLRPLWQEIAAFLAGEGA